MQTSQDVAVIQRRHDLGWGVKRIARELGCRKNTVRRYLAQGGWMPYRVVHRDGRLSGLEDWLAASFRPHRGNAEVVRQELERVHGRRVSLRTVERAVPPWRQALAAEAPATVRFETPPGRQLQIDFGTTTVSIADDRVGGRLFVATLGYSRRTFVAVFLHERQSAWLDGLEQAFHYFGGIPEAIRLDNPRALVTGHDPVTRAVVFHERFLAFARYWGFQPRAGAPYRARTKGKTENGVGYVKHNGIAGRPFASWAALEAHLSAWRRTVADERLHGTTGDRPRDRFAHAEAAARRPLAGRPPFQMSRELHRPVPSASCIEIDTNHYSVPWRRIGKAVTVRVVDQEVPILYGGEEVARHPPGAGRRQRYVNPGHRVGVVGGPRPAAAGTAPVRVPPAPDRRRPLSDYEAAVGGAW